MKKEIFAGLAIIGCMTAGIMGLAQDPESTGPPIIAAPTPSPEMVAKIAALAKVDRTIRENQLEFCARFVGAVCADDELTSDTERLDTIKAWFAFVEAHQGRGNVPTVQEALALPEAAQRASMRVAAIIWDREVAAEEAAAAKKRAEVEALVTVVQ